MKPLIILGTGVHAGEMAHIVERVNRGTPTWELLGHISPKEDSASSFAGYPVLGAASSLAEILKRHPEAMLVPDNEFPKDIPLPEDRLATLVDPSCYLHPTACIGAGSVLYPNCFAGLNAVIGQRVFLLANCTINHDCCLEDRVVGATGVTLAGGVKVGTGAYLGQGCTVRQFLSVGSKALVGMGAVVVKNVEPGQVVAGNPAAPLRPRH